MCPERVVGEGRLVRDQPLTPKTDYCRDCINVCTKIDPSGASYGRCCNCPGITKGKLVNNVPSMPNTYYCVP